MIMAFALTLKVTRPKPPSLDGISCMQGDAYYNSTLEGLSAINAGGDINDVYNNNNNKIFI